MKISDVKRLWLRLPLLMFCVMLSISFAAAQNQPPTAVPVTARNVNRLQSIAHIDFSDTGTSFATGWFAMSGDGLYVMAAAGNTLFPYQLNVAGTVSAGTRINIGQNSSVDVQYSDADLPYGLFSQGDEYQVFALRSNGGMTALSAPESGRPLSLWLTGQHVWLEAIPADPTSDTVVLQYPSLLNADELTEIPAVTRPYAPAADEEAVVRIGRISPPYVVTSSITGVVKLWSLESGRVLSEVNNDTGGPSVFGNINARATHLVWRDDSSENLYLLNLGTGRNQKVADLGGEYVQWFFLSNDASVILAVNQNFEPVVAAWNVATGEKTVLGEYRSCSRPQPDMARLSEDGSTLVIGCDTGLDVWRVR